MKKIIAIMMLLLAPVLAYAACGGSSPTWTSASSERTDVADCVATASNGDTIIVPTGTSTWASVITIPSTKGLIIKGCATTSGCSGETIINTASFFVYTAPTVVTKINGFTFNGGSGQKLFVDGSTNGDCETDGCVNTVRVNNNRFLNQSKMEWRGRVWGLIDHNYITYPTIFTWLLVYGSPTGGEGDGGSAEWKRDTDLRTEKFVFIENNISEIGTMDLGAGFADGRSGGRIVLRYNSITNHPLGWHDAETQYQRGMRAWEIYNNVLKESAAVGGGSLYASFFTRGGTGVIFNNQFPSNDLTNNIPIIFSNSRSFVGSNITGWPSLCNSSGNGKFCLNGPVIGCSVDGDCTGANSGPCVSIDNVSNGWPCRDQIGRGKEDATTGVQASEPVLGWNNKYCEAVGGACTPTTLTGFGKNDTLGYLNSNSDFCGKVCPGTSTPCASTSDCAGCGASSTMPSSCSGVSTTYTTPYQFPHPLDTDHAGWTLKSAGCVGADCLQSPDGSDTTRPTIDAFTVPATATSLTVSISSFTASDNVAVTGYCVNESSSAPTAGSCSGSGWAGSRQSSYVFANAGSKTLYAWAKDAAGNISTSLNDSVTITLPPNIILWRIN